MKTNKIRRQFTIALAHKKIALLTDTHYPKMRLAKSRNVNLAPSIRYTMYRFLVTLLASLFLVFLALPASSQSVADTVVDTRLLNEVTVIGYDANRKLLQTAGSVDLIDTDRIGAYDETSLVPAMNTLPGVRMEERAPGSYRIAIRGSALRAPFGVRNIKVYWNDIPFTDPTGNTSFNLLDVVNINHIEVIKGPAGSVYGAGTGGVVNIRSISNDSYSVPTVQLGATLGSYGLQRYTGQVNVQTENTTLAVKYAHPPPPPASRRLSRSRGDEARCAGAHRPISGIGGPAN